MIRTLAAIAFLTLVTGCAPSEIEVKRALAREAAELAVDGEIASLLASIRIQQATITDCSRETGDSAQQCAAFASRMKPETEKFLAKERDDAKSALSDTVDEIALAISDLSVEELSNLRDFLRLPESDRSQQVLPPRLSQTMIEGMAPVWPRLEPIDRGVGDRYGFLVMRIATEMMAAAR